MASQNDSSLLKHPFILAAIPAVAGIVAAVVSVLPESDASLPPQPAGNAQPPTASAGIAFRVDRDFDVYSDGWQAAFETALPSTTQLPEKLDYVSLLEWALARGAVEVGQSHLRLYLENDGRERVTVRNIKAKVVERSEPISQTLLTAPSAGVNELVDLRFDLDSGDLVQALTPASPDDDTELQPFFLAKNISLEPTESTDIQLTVSTHSCFCRYFFEVEFVKADSVATLQIGDPSGRPLTISALAQDYSQRFSDGTLTCQIEGLFAESPEGEVDCTEPG